MKKFDSTTNVRITTILIWILLLFRVNYQQLYPHHKNYQRQFPFLRHTASNIALTFITNTTYIIIIIVTTWKHTRFSRCGSYNHINNNHSLIPFPPAVPLKIKMVSCGLVKAAEIAKDADVWVEIRGVLNRVIALISPKAKRSKLTVLYFQTTSSFLYISASAHIFPLGS